MAKKKVISQLLAIVFIVIAMSFGSSSPSTVVYAESETFQNPIALAKDPQVTYHDGYYYSVLAQKGTSSNPNDTLVIYKSKYLTHLYKDGYNTKKIINNSSFTTNNWAPEIHYYNNKFYIYTSDWNKRIGVYESNTSDAMGDYTLKNSDVVGGYVWDPHLYKRADGTLWLLYSKDFLYIQKMSNPWTKDSASNPVKLCSNDTYTWEYETKKINENPYIFDRDGKIYMIYSADEWSNDHYKTGLLTFTGTSSDRLDNPAKWTKKSMPAFTRANGVTGTAGGSIVKSPDGTQYWHIFHAYSGTTSRYTRIQPITWNGDEPDFGIPQPDSYDWNVPSGQPTLPSNPITGLKRLKIDTTLGDYYLRAAYNNGYTDGTNVELYQWNDWASQKWFIEDIGSGKYRLKIDTTLGDYYLRAAYNNGYTDGTNVELYQWNDWASQKWILEDIGSGKYRLKIDTNLGDYYLRANYNGGYTDGTNVELYQWNDWASQKWIIEDCP